MKRIVYHLLFICCFIITFQALAFVKDTHSNELFEGIYKIVTEKDNPLVVRAKTVFNRILKVVNKRTEKYPKIVIIKKNTRQWASARKDGTVILTENGLNFCYQVQDKAIGDARMSIILGHEMAHLAKDHFGKIDVFASAQDIEVNFLEIMNHSKKKQSTPLGKYIDKLEHHADFQGVIYATMAGYDPSRVFDTNDNNFFQELSAQIESKTGQFNASKSLNHNERLNVLMSNIQNIKDKVILFYLGVRLYQIGEYDDALQFFQEFLNFFPSREVYNNIGLIYYQKAVDALPKKNNSKTFQYKLSTFIDTETRAVNLIPRSQDIFNDNISKAIDQLKIACNMDYYYIPAYVNLSSALIMSARFETPEELSELDHFEERINDAKSFAEKALRRNKNCHEALNNKAIAMYLQNPSQHYSESIKLLESLPDSQYNIGRLHFEQGNKDKARSFWKKYLQTDPSSEYANQINDSFKLASPVNKHDQSMASFFRDQPLKPGDVNTDTENVLQQEFHGKKMILKFGKLEGEYYKNNELEVLILADVVKFVEKTVDKKMSYQNFKIQPQKLFTSVQDIETFVFQNFALDVYQNRIQKVIYFL